MSRLSGRLWVRLLVIAAVGLCVTFAVAELADVYLKSGLKLRGEVTVTEAEVVVRNDLGEVRFPRDQVERVVPVEAARSQPATQPASQPVEQPPAVAGGPPEPAAAEPDRIPAPPLLSALDIQRLKMTELRVDGPPERVRLRYPKRQDRRELPQEVLRELSQQRMIPQRWQETLLHGETYEKLQVIVRTTGTKYAGRIVITSDPEVFATFRTRVLPMVVKGCARAGCHSGKDAVALRFPDGPKQSEEFVYTTFVLLDRLETPHGPLIDRDYPSGSVLLSYILPQKDNLQPHPPVKSKRRFTPALRRADIPPYERILNWIDSLRTPRPNYGLDYAFPPGPPQAWPVEPELEKGPPASQPASQPARQP